MRSWFRWVDDDGKFRPEQLYNESTFTDDSNPCVLKPNAFKHLDLVLSICAAQSIYVITDMRTAQGDTAVRISISLDSGNT